MPTGDWQLKDIKEVSSKAILRHSLKKHISRALSNATEAKQPTKQEKRPEIPTWRAVEQRARKSKRAAQQTHSELGGK